VIIDPLLSNPLLSKDEIPDFTKINAKAVESAIPMLLEQDDKSFKEYEKHLKMLVAKNKVTWEAVETLDEKRVDPLGRAWGAASNMLSIKNNKEIRKAIEKYQGNVTEQGTKQGQSHVIYEAYKLLSKQKLNEGQRRIVDKAIRGLEHGGVNLPPNDKKKFIETIKSLSELTHKFKNNVLDYTSKFSMMVYNRTQLEGLPKDFLKKAAEKAAKKLKLKGKPTPDIGP
jgi:oligopeptidase A